MKIIDMHIHAKNTKPDPEGLIKNMEKCGVYGGCVFSNIPQISDEKLGTSWKERLNEVLGWAKGYEDRIFPVMWIHPYEENIIENIRDAVKKGVCGFKFICDDYYVYDEKCMEVLREIASLNVPVFFHSGILWDGKVSSEYNRPINWEKLIEIEGLRFAMAHCSWPWIDECVALYGQFLNASSVRSTPEMFFDTTPGTPEIYRQDLLKKLYMCEYDTGSNIMFGTDSDANDYGCYWAEKWLGIDGQIMEEMGVSRENLENHYYNNVMRFLGKCDAVKEHTVPAPDEPGKWYPNNPEVPKIIEKWYKKIGFPKEYDREFYKALEEIKISDAVSLEKYDLFSTNGKRNLLTVLYLCEELKDKYVQRGIDEEILMDTIRDMVIWTNIWTDLKGELYLGQLDWISLYMNFTLFKLGRVQFNMAQAYTDIPQKNIKKGDNVLEIHIQAGSPLEGDEIIKSIKRAKEFFAKYFPEFEYKAITTHTWLLDDTLDELLKSESNILKFKAMFDCVHSEESDAILRYLFRWDTTRHNIRYAVSYGSFPERVKKHFLEGNKFHEVLGVLNEQYFN